MFRFQLEITHFFTYLGLSNRYYHIPTGAFDQIIISKQKALYFTASVYTFDWSGNVIWEDNGLFNCTFSLLIFERVYSLFPWLRKEDGNFPNIFLHFYQKLSIVLGCWYAQICQTTRGLCNLWLKMTKNDKFQYLVIPPTSKEQLWNQGE